MSIPRQPCIRKGVVSTPGFIVGRTRKAVAVLYNAVWAIIVRQIPMAEYNEHYQAVVYEEVRAQEILKGMKDYAIYAGMTPEAAEFLPQLYPMSKEEIKVASDKGVETLERHKDQAVDEEVKEKRLFGAALKSKLAKDAREAAATAEKLDDQIVEPGTSTNATEKAGVQADDVGTDEPVLPKPKIVPSTVERRRTGKKATEARQLAKEVSEALVEAEQNGENPAAVLKKAKPPVEKKDPNDFKSASAMFKALILKAHKAKKPQTDDEIFAEVQAKFGLDDNKKGYVGWNRNWLKNQGQLS